MTTIFDTRSSQRMISNHHLAGISGLDVARGIEKDYSRVNKLSLLWSPEPDSQIWYQVKHTLGLATEGSNYLSHKYDYPPGFSGPGILKIQANSSANNTDVSGGFDLILVDN